MAHLPSSYRVDRDNQALHGLVWEPVLLGFGAGVSGSAHLLHPGLEAGSVGHGGADGPGCCLHMVCMGQLQQWETGVTRNDDCKGFH